MNASTSLESCFANFSQKLLMWILIMCLKLFNHHRNSSQKFTDENEKFAFLMGYIQVQYSLLYYLATVDIAM